MRDPRDRIASFEGSYSPVVKSSGGTFVSVPKEK